MFWATRPPSTAVLESIHELENLMAILLIRHGETELNRARVVQPKDTPLSAKGIEQVQALAERLTERPIERILSSDLQRAQMTAQAVAARFDLPITSNPLLRERDFGSLCGTPYSELTFDLFGEDYVPPEGESWSQFRVRAAAAFELVVQHVADLSGDLAVVTHGLMCHTLIAGHAALAKDMELPSYWYNAGLTMLVPQAPHSVLLLNCAAHLGYPAAQGVSGL